MSPTTDPASIMPGHLPHSFKKMGRYSPGRIRQKLDSGFLYFKDQVFRPWLVRSTNYRWTTLAIAMSSLLVVSGWVAGGRLAFEFFPTAEADRIFANISFVSGTSKDTVIDYLSQAEEAIYEIEAENDETFIDMVVFRHGIVQGVSARGDQYGSIRLELVDPDQRSTRNREIIEAWKSRLPQVPGIENIAILEPRAGPPGSDSGASPARRPRRRCAAPAK